MPFNLLYGKIWPWTLNTLISKYPVLGLREYNTKPGLYILSMSTMLVDPFMLLFVLIMLLNTNAVISYSHVLLDICVVSRFLLL